MNKDIITGIIIGSLATTVGVFIGIIINEIKNKK